MNEWQGVWARRAVFREHRTTIGRLLELDGFTAPFSDGVNGASIRAYAHEVAARIDLSPLETIFEVGCGSGAFLYPFYEDRHPVAGLDYSSRLIEEARAAMPEYHGCFVVADALEGITQGADVMVSHQALHYLSTWEDAMSVLLDMIEGAGRVVALLGLPDVRLRDEAEAFRRANLPAGVHPAAYDSLPTLYFDPAELQRLAASCGMASTLYPHALSGFTQAKFRFDWILEKRPVSE